MRVNLRPQTYSIGLLFTLQFSTRNDSQLKHIYRDILLGILLNKNICLCNYKDDPYGKQVVDGSQKPRVALGWIVSVREQVRLPVAS